MAPLARGTVLVALAGMVTASVAVTHTVGVQDERALSVGRQPTFEPRLGLWLADVSQPPVSAQPAVVVREVIPRSGADQAGVREGDLLVECQAEPVDSVEEVARLLEEASFASLVRIGVRREGKRLDVKVRLDAPSWAHLRAPFTRGSIREGVYLRMLPMGGTERLGLTGLEMTAQLAEYFGTDGGVLISDVRHSSPADRAGLKAGDVVTRIDGHKVRTERDLAAALHRNLAGARLTVSVKRDGRNAVIAVKVPR